MRSGGASGFIYAGVYIPVRPNHSSRNLRNPSNRVRSFGFCLEVMLPIRALFRIVVASIVCKLISPWTQHHCKPVVDLAANVVSGPHTYLGIRRWRPRPARIVGRSIRCALVGTLQRVIDPAPRPVVVSVLSSPSNASASSYVEGLPPVGSPGLRVNQSLSPLCRSHLASSVPDSSHVITTKERVDQ